MKYVHKVLSVLFVILTVNAGFMSVNMPGGSILTVIAVLYFLFVNIMPTFCKQPSFRLKMLADGTELLKLFAITTLISVVYAFYLLMGKNFHSVWQLVFYLVIAVLAETVLFWNGIIRVYTTSVQLGIKWRILGAVCGWIPIVHLFTLGKIIHITSTEVEFELEKYELDIARKENEECKTKYPVLMVHGVFFRDSRFFNYWGRVPGALIKNGVRIYYGEQQSAASVQKTGEELAGRIQKIIKETGSEKVNIIAHSKGGLDCRYAISKMGMDQYVASLTTVNTPHRGCLFAEYLLSKIPEKACSLIARKYNNTVKKLGDTNPDFMAAVRDLTVSACEKMNQSVLDMPGVYYQSVGTKMNHAHSAKFPLNIAYPLVHHFDGDNDGLVSVESAKWGEKFTFVSVKGWRGISHADVIDLNRENIRDFDIREFYVDLVKDLKAKGF